jgi:hypothetical protein
MLSGEGIGHAEVARESWFWAEFRTEAPAGIVLPDEHIVRRSVRDTERCYADLDVVGGMSSSPVRRDSNGLPGIVVASLAEPGKSSAPTKVFGDAS